MSLLNVPAGKDLPEDIYVVIEIPANADPIKYEVDKESGALFVDRFHVHGNVLSVQLRLHQPHPCPWTATRLTCWSRLRTRCSRAP